MMKMTWNDNGETWKIVNSINLLQSTRQILERRKVETKKIKGSYVNITSNLKLPKLESVTCKKPGESSSIKPSFFWTELDWTELQRET